jgi:hypothetical protein
LENHYAAALQKGRTMAMENAVRVPRNVTKNATGGF